MTAIDNEIEQLRRRIADLEEKKLEEAKSKAKPTALLEEFIRQKKLQIDRNKYSKNAPLAGLYDREKLEFLQPILDALNDINERLACLESKSG